MSNLKLPNMSYMPLKGFLEKERNKRSRTLAFKTEAIINSPGSPEVTIYVYHHNSCIASIAPFEVEVTNAGWDSSTTRNRINAILRDNEIPFFVRQENFTQYLYECVSYYDGFKIADKHVRVNAIDTSFSYASFAMVSGVWRLTKIETR